MSYVTTELSPSPTDIKVQKIGDFLEIRTPLLAVGEYQGGDRVVDGKRVEQAKIFYPPDILPILAKTALGVNGDIEHSDSKFDVVSVLKGVDMTDPNILYGNILVTKPSMIQQILAGKYGGVSVQARIETEYNKEDERFVAVGGEFLAYGHTDNPAVPQAKIESMNTIALSHNIIETFNKDCTENSNYNKTKSDSMTNEDKVVELSAKLAEQSVMLSDRDKQIEALSTEVDKLSEVSVELEQSVATGKDQEAKLVELTTKMSEMETAIQLKEQEAQEKELEVLLTDIKKLDEKFEAKTYLHESMNFESKKQILEAILADKNKLSKSVTLSGLPGESKDGDVDVKALTEALGGIPFEVALGGRDEDLFFLD